MDEFTQGWDDGYLFPFKEREETIARERGGEYWKGYKNGQRQRKEEMSCVRDGPVFTRGGGVGGTH